MKLFSLIILLFSALCFADKQIQIPLDECDNPKISMRENSAYLVDGNKVLHNFSRHRLSVEGLVNQNGDLRHDRDVRMSVYGSSGRELYFISTWSNTDGSFGRIWVIQRLDGSVQLKLNWFYTDDYDNFAQAYKNRLFRFIVNKEFLVFFNQKDLIDQRVMDKVTSTWQPSEDIANRIEELVLIIGKESYKERHMAQLELMSMGEDGVAYIIRHMQLWHLSIEQRHILEYIISDTLDDT
jgi:hypothetical protein